ncbi:MAG: ABC transporter permease [bacterium]|nr:ABC transporter permease [bacterium]
MLNRAQLNYLASESFAGFRRRKLTTGVTILIMASALLVLAALTLVTLNLGTLLETARGGLDLRVYLRDDMPPERLAELRPRLLTIPGVEQVQWIDSEAALAEFRQQLGEDAPLLDLLDRNPLPSSYHVTFTAGARDPESVRAIRDEIVRWEEVSEILFNQDWVEALERWTFRFQMASLVVGMLVFLAAIFVISNTVKLTIASSSRIIQIQKLVGATNAFIRTPFLCEGVVQGLLAGLLAMGLLFVAGRILGASLNGLVFFTAAQTMGFVAFCVLLGLAGSWAAMRKYLTLRSDI